ncbi:OmpA family protein [Hymenobacter sp. GOD-10R]|uniref:OmpA family protein n=1 Tax=Hymenobacter sp. GOD-10R TaxID=3093922 RepID=UPI002D789B8D|nr:OmpA family protein [Hymenobacter sp. GOD-10R]WRQ28014.1 OmpA family protein [Hymenobacter sp. GOD-10R]
MTQSLLEEIKSFILRNALTQTGDLAREEELGIRSALRRIVPLTVNSLIELAERVGGREVVWGMAREASKASVLNNPQQMLQHEAAVDANRGVNLIKSLLEDRYQGAVRSIAVAAGIQTTSVADLLNIVVPVALGMLGEQVAEHGWNAEELSLWLQSQREQHPAQPVAATPMLASMPSVEMPRPAMAVAQTADKTSRWLWVALVVAAATIGYLVGYKPGAVEAPSSAALAGVDGFATPANATNKKVGAETNAPAAVNGHYDAASGNYIYDTGLPTVLKLSNGTKQIVGANSTESKLYEFLVDPATEVDSVNRTKGWISFDRVYFDPNKTTLTAESLVQLQNVADILKTFPTAKVKIGGYTDTRGDAFKNLKLSEERAKSAMATLINMGIPTERIEAKGYGDKHGIASNDTEDGRALNRRISLRVTRK